jgi:hypothetical protein
MCSAMEGREVMFAMRENLYIFDDDQLFVAKIKGCG